MKIINFLKKYNINYGLFILGSGVNVYAVNRENFDFIRNNIKVRLWNTTPDNIMFMSISDYETNTIYCKNQRFLNDVFFITLKEVLNAGADYASAQNMAKRKQYTEAVKIGAIDIYNKIYA